MLRWWQLQRSHTDFARVVEEGLKRVVSARLTQRIVVTTVFHNFGYAVGWRAKWRGFHFCHAMLFRSMLEWFETLAKKSHVGSAA